MVQNPRRKIRHIVPHRSPRSRPKKPSSNLLKSKISFTTIFLKPLFTIPKLIFKVPSTIPNRVPGHFPSFISRFARESPSKLGAILPLGPSLLWGFLAAIPPLGPSVPWGHTSLGAIPPLGPSHTWGHTVLGAIPCLGPSLPWAHPVLGPNASLQVVTVRSPCKSIAHANQQTA